MVTMLSHLREKMKEHAKDFNSSYERFLYILGYMDGMKSQREFDWCNITDEDRKALIKEATISREKES